MKTKLTAYEQRRLVINEVVEELVKQRGVSYACGYLCSVMVGLGAQTAKNADYVLDMIGPAIKSKKY